MLSQYLVGITYTWKLNEAYLPLIRKQKHKKAFVLRNPRRVLFSISVR